MIVEALSRRLSKLLMLPPGTEEKKATICSDSEALIKSVISPITTSKLVKEFKATLNEMGLRNQITLAWAPGHSGVEGNEMADELARQGSASVSNDPEPVIPIPNSLCNRAMRDWIRSECAKHWSAYGGGMHTKCFFPVPDEKWTKELLSMDRCRIRRVVGAITGHCGLSKHLSKMGLLNDPNCTCGYGAETGIHVICDCPKYSLLRLRILGGHVIRPLDVPKLGPTTLDRFLIGTGRFE